MSLMRRLPGKKWALEYIGDQEIAAWVAAAGQ
jgi:hypothetical protein